jgi:hypothetical protein
MHNVLESRQETENQQKIMLLYTTKQLYFPIVTCKYARK